MFFNKQKRVLFFFIYLGPPPIFLSQCRHVSKSTPAAMTCASVCGIRRGCRHGQPFGAQRTKRSAHPARTLLPPHMFSLPRGSIQRYRGPKTNKR